MRAGDARGPWARGPGWPSRIAPRLRPELKGSRRPGGRAGPPGGLIAPPRPPRPIPGPGAERRAPEAPRGSQGALLDAVVGGLRTRPSVPRDRLPRRADIARWGAAVGRSLARLGSGGVPGLRRGQPGVGERSGRGGLSRVARGAWDEGPTPGGMDRDGDRAAIACQESNVSRSGSSEAWTKLCNNS